MATAVIRDVAVSNILSKNTGIIEEKSCSKCYDSEMQLKEVLSELSSAQMIISILQKELNQPQLQPQHQEMPENLMVSQIKRYGRQ